MQITYGLTVYAADGEKLGKVKELVVDPRHRVVTHLVVQQGLFFTHDRLITAEHIKATDENGVYLSCDSNELEMSSQPFNHQQYVELKDEDLMARSGVGGAVWMPPENEFGGAGLNSLVPPGIGPIPPEPEVSIPNDSVGLSHGARVISEDGVNLGSVQEFQTNNDEEITHIVISEGHLFKETKKIPVDWIRKISEEEIALGVPLSVIEQL